MRSKRCDCEHVKQQDSSFEIRWDYLFEERCRETKNTFYLKLGWNEE